MLQNWLVQYFKLLACSSVLCVSTLTYHGNNQGGEVEIFQDTQGIIELRGEFKCTLDRSSSFK